MRKVSRGQRFWEKVSSLHNAGEITEVRQVKMKNKKLKDGDYRFIEKLLYDQKTHKTAIAELEAALENVIPSATSSFVTFSRNQKNPKLTEPERIVDKRLHSVKGKYIQGEIKRRRRHQDEIKRRRRHQDAICEAMNSLSDVENQLVHLYYDLEKPARECWWTMGYEKSRWYEIKNEIVCKVARFLGLG